MFFIDGRAVWQCPVVVHRAFVITAEDESRATGKFVRIPGRAGFAWPGLKQRQSTKAENAAIPDWAGTRR